MASDTKLNLVLYEEAVLEVVALVRVLEQERGNYMFVGVGGSGKTTISQLGADMASCTWVTLEMRKNYSEKEFREDIFNMMKLVVFEEKNLCFGLSDGQILD
jgi:dynein heavy chain